ncbi:hypothetical protein K2173_002168 [Erythroxylum novogranatense]|uniref:Uncharacterized protein n=1 Tax=Erythroxylum novogranatense TaxID=1862640 RepID=A0AAV8SQD0_9ROSI|nr:hypothetical protein K2173_002168 [Erythroxylum novogranatense]
MAYFCSFIELMDSLWFHSEILSLEPSAKPVSEIPSSLIVTESMIYPSSTDFSLLTPPDDQISLATSSPPEYETASSSASSPLSLLVIKTITSFYTYVDFFASSFLSIFDDIFLVVFKDEADKIGDKDEVEQRERPTRFNLITSRARFHSSSPSAGKRSKRTRCGACTLGRLQKSMSCRNLEDLELEEVQGFMDLGFVFNKENLSPRMISLVPGLQRLGLCKKLINNSSLIDSGSVAEGDDNKLREEEAEAEQERVVIRPYLSEAWLIKRPDSPLLKLRLARVSAPSDMKKHLRFWAKTVASVIHQES